MEYLFLIITVVAVTAQSIFQKQYSLKSENPNPLLFSALSSLTVLIFFVLISGFRFEFSQQIAPYSLVFALTYAIGLAGMVFSIKFGSLAIAMLIASYSLIIPTFYGIIFLSEPVRVTAYFGIGLLMISLFLINIKKEKVKFSLKFFLSLTALFLGNGLCSVVQKIQQIKFGGGNKNEFMILGFIIVSVLLFGISLPKSRNIGKQIKDSLFFAVPNGLANSLVNLFVLTLTGLIPNTILFPSISGGGIVLAFITAVLIYKERLSPAQIIGYAAGTASVVLLNL